MLKVEVVGKNGFEPSNSNKEYAVKKLSKLEQYFEDEGELQARVVCKVYPTYHKVEITVPTKNVLLRSEVMEKDIYAAIDCSIDKLMKQVRKYKTKFKDNSNKDGIKEVAALYEEKEEVTPRFVRDKQIELEPMTKEEALDQMELLGHDFFVYLDKNTHKTNVIYLRDDGDYAVIETKTK